MEEILKQLLEQNNDSWTGVLTDKAGFGAEQAQGFLGGFVERVTTLFKGGKLDPGALLGGDVSSLVSELDLAELGSSVGVDAHKAEEGVRAVAPEIIDAVKDKMGGGGILDLLGGAGGLGKLFGL